MKILTVDIGTGTQDIFLYDSNLDIENGFKLVLPSPQMIACPSFPPSASIVKVQPLLGLDAVGVCRVSQ